jgi:ribosomal protein L11 methyltransferase
MPYRIDFRDAASGCLLERLIELGALDTELSNGVLSAVMPDCVTADEVAQTLGIADISISPAIGRDEGSVWVLNPRPVHCGRLRILPEEMQPEPGALTLIDATAFGTGLHPTTALCLEALDEVVHVASPASMLDVGTGSGVLALAGLVLGVTRAMAIDTDATALHIAAENARINGLDRRLQLAQGGPEIVSGTWPVVFANILPAPLIEMAPALVRRVGHAGELVLSGIPCSVEEDVDRVYRHLGMHRKAVKSRAGWIALILRASW